MCCVRVGNQKLQARWRAEQNKRQRILRYEKTGFYFVGKLLVYPFNEIRKFNNRIRVLNAISYRW